MHTAAVFACALGLLGCGRDAGRAPPPPPAAGGSASAPPAPVPAAPGVRLVAAGQAPRHALRYRLARGQTSRVAFAIDTDLQLGGGVGGMLPTMVLTAVIDVDDTLADGAMKLRLTTHDIGARDRPGAPLAGATFATQLRPLEGLAVTATMSPSGALREPHVDLSQVPANLRDQLGGMVDNLQQLALPLPTEEVGVGARWEYARTVTQGGMTMTTTTTSELAAVDGDHVTITSTSRVAAPAQTITLGGTTVEVERVTGEGHGQVTLDLARMVTTGSVQSQFAATLRSGGQTTTMSMAAGIRLSEAR